MPDCKDLVEMAKTWLSDLEKAMQQELGKDMCEACRMAISILSLLWAYFPGSEAEELTKKAKGKFKEALARLGSMLDRETNSENAEYLELYKRNIQMRLDTLEVLPKEACEVYNSEEFNDDERWIGRQSPLP